MRHVLQGLALAGSFSLLALLAADRLQAQTPPKKIVFIAGPKEHGAPGRHEYEKDLRELAWSLEHASNLKGVKTEVLIGRVPKDLKALEDADEIVIDGNGDWLKTETGILSANGRYRRHHL